MIKHVVCFKLKEPTEENCLKAKELLLGMQGKVEMLRSIEVGVDFLHSDRSYDLILITAFDSREDLDAYQKHPYHVEVVKKHMHQVRLTSVAVDWEA